MRASMFKGHVAIETAIMVQHFTTDVAKVVYDMYVFIYA